MDNYTLSCWLIFFFFYSFIGWVWECLFVSFQKIIIDKKFIFINRGFLHGPFIPIYGFSALAILLAVLPYQNDIFYIFIIGALSATLFEYITGSLLEKLFNVRYWDYSDYPLNYRGHICLFISLFWGFLAIILIRFIHNPLSKIILTFDQFVLNIILVILIILFIYDFIKSLEEAIDLKELVDRFNDYSLTVDKLENHFHSLALVAHLDLEDSKYISDKSKDKLHNKIDSLHKQHLSRLKSITDKLDSLNDLSNDIRDVLYRAESLLKIIFSSDHKKFLNAQRLLKRNPNTHSRRYENILKEIKDLFDQD